MMGLFTQDQPPYGYHCGTCQHLWDAYGPGGRKDEVLAHIKANRHCPACGSERVRIHNPERYAELKAERVKQYLQGMGAGTA